MAKRKKSRGPLKGSKELLKDVENFAIKLLGNNAAITKNKFTTEIMNNQAILAKAIVTFGFNYYIGFNIDNLLKKSKIIKIININKNINDGILDINQYSLISKRATWFIGYSKTEYRIRMINSVLDETNI